MHLILEKALCDIIIVLAFFIEARWTPSHTSRVTQVHLVEATPNFINKDKWPPQSNDCNPTDYAMWGSLKEKVFRGVQALMNRKIIPWEEILIEEIRKNISTWKKRLRSVVEEDAGHIENRQIYEFYSVVAFFEFDNTCIICN